jgi:hypothetical protein
MIKVTVFKFALIDRKTGKTIEQPRMATRHAIRRLYAEADLESELLVDEEDLDSEGIYRPPSET